MPWLRFRRRVPSAFATDTALALAHVDIAEKSDEIPAAQARLAELGPAPGAVVTLDAPHCQKPPTVAAVATVALIVRVKDNQPTLCQAIQEASATPTPLGTAHSHDVTLGEDRSRIRTNPGVFARLRRFAVNILQANRTNTLSQGRCRASLSGIHQPLKILAIPQR